MKIFKYILSTVTLTAVSFIALKAQTYKLPGEHQKEHSELIAKQQNLNNQIKVEETQAFLDNFFTEEEEPEMDIFLEGWNSKLVNPFNEADVPQTAQIDVSNFCMPHTGYLTSPYGYRKRFRREHKGVDLKLYVGDTVRAAFDGKVRLTNFERKGYGYYIIIRHTNGLETVYGHLSKFIVQDGDAVKAGDPIALGGNTGRSTGPHLHFETRYMGYPINPAGIFDFVNQTVHTDLYTFDKSSYKEARNYDPAANTEYARQWQEQYLSTHPQANQQRASSSNSPSYYTVRKGDSLSKIASRNGVTVKNLCKLNGIKTTDKIRPGQKLRIR